MNDTIHYKDSTKICHDQVENALHFIENAILNEPSYSIRPSLLDVMFFDEFTSSNAEAEHSALKKKSLGIVATQKVSTLFRKADMDATKRGQNNLIARNKDIGLTMISTKCQLSKEIVRVCFDELLKRIELAKSCVSKQTIYSQWIVIYIGHKTYNTDYKLHFLPRIKRKRYVKLNNGKFMICIIVF